MSADNLILDQPVNVKAEGEKTMRKGVTLIADPDNADVVRVRTGKRGRPGSLNVENIVNVRAL